MSSDPGATARPRARRKKTPVDQAPAPAADAAAADVQSPAAALFVAELDARWRDLDAFNHVNNATYLTYLEEARLQWLRHVPGPWFDEASMPVLAASHLNYRQPIAWPARLAIELRCERLGHSSVTLAHRLVDAEDRERLYCDGHVVLVWMDPSTGKPVPLPPAIREAATAA